MIPAEAVEAAAKWLHDVDCRSAVHAGHPADFECYSWLDEAKELLEVVAPYMLGHEREQTRLAHLDAMVNRETKRDELAAEYRRGYRDGLADRKQVTK